MCTEGTFIVKSEVKFDQVLCIRINCIFIMKLKYFICRAFENSKMCMSELHLRPHGVMPIYNRSYMGITTHQQWNKGRPSNFMMWAKRIFSKKKNTFSILCLLNIIFKFRGLQKIGLALWRWSATRFHLSAGPVNNPPTNWQHEKLCRVRFKNFNLNKKVICMASKHKESKMY